MAVQSVMPNLYSADVARAVAFYRDLLGGTQTFRHPAEGKAEHVELRLGDIMIAISSKQAVEAEGMPAPTAGHPMELVVGCDSADDTVAALRAGLATEVVPHDQLLATARQVAASIVGNNQNAVRALLASYHRIDESQTSEGLWLEAMAARQFRTTGDDIAAACLYLVSEEASYVTGQTVSVNGGSFVGW